MTVVNPSTLSAPGESRGETIARSTAGFGSFAEYGGVFWSQQERAFTWPKLVLKRVFLTKTPAQMKEDVQETSGVELKKTLGVFELITMGVGFMCGAGIFVSPGFIAATLTGPALFLAYLSAAVSAYLSCFCYAEFSVSIPLAGAAYNYIYSTLGELIAWITVSNLLFEYILSIAAVGRGFSPYLARLFNQKSTFFYRSYKSYALDGWACGLILFCTAIQCWGVAESAAVNSVITCMQVVVLVFIIIAGLTKADRANFTPFIKPGGTWKNIFNGAAVSFFSFIGFDALATTAEEQRDPARDMPRGILGAVSIITVLYTMVCVTLSLMVPNSAIDANAAFASAFDTVGMQWAKYVVCIGAVLGIFTTVFMALLGAARILTGCSRERMLPPIFAWVSKSRQTPYVATITIGLIGGGIALFSEFAELSDMISIGTLLVFFFVAVGLLWFRCNVRGKTSFKSQCLLLLHTVAIVGFAMGFTLIWSLPEYAQRIPSYVAPNGAIMPEVPAGPSYGRQAGGLIAMAVLFIASVVSMTFVCKQEYIPATYKVPLFPAIPALSIFVNIFLLGQLSKRSYERFAWWVIGTICLYLFYGMISQEAHDKLMFSRLQGLPTVEDLRQASKLSDDSTRSEARPGVLRVAAPSP
ncbi:amino acid permease-domain-containing protein [Haematococcus lacustris]